MDAITIKKGINTLYSSIEEKLPPAGWYFTDTPPVDAIIPAEDTWECMFRHFERLLAGEPLCISAGRPGCSGAACYLGFTSPAEDAGRYLAEKEKFKKNARLGELFYQGISAPPAHSAYLVFQSINDVADDQVVEVITLWITAENLADLVTLANYDRPDNNNVIIPFGSGCQSIWTLPYKEKDSDAAKCVVGCMDPAMRRYIPSDILSFSAPAHRIVAMTDNIAGSFLDRRSS